MDRDIVGLIVLLASLIGACTACAWAWRGRSSAARAWIRWLPTRRFVLGILPTGCAMFIALIIGMSFATAGLDLVAYFFAAVALVATVFLVHFSTYGRIPDWWGPSWYRAMAQRGELPIDRVTPGALQWMDEPPRRSSRDSGDGAG